MCINLNKYLRYEGIFWKYSHAWKSLSNLPPFQGFSNGGKFESDFQAWEYFVVGSGLPGGGSKCHILYQVTKDHNVITSGLLLLCYVII